MNSTWVNPFLCYSFEEEAVADEESEVKANDVIDDVGDEATEEDNPFVDAKTIMDAVPVRYVAMLPC